MKTKEPKNQAMAASTTPKDVEMTAPPEAVSVGPDYSSISSSMALVREAGDGIYCSESMMNILNQNLYDNCKGNKSTHLPRRSPSSDEFDLITQRLSSLMEEGRGEAIYDVGVPLVDSDENGTAG